MSFRNLGSFVQALRARGELVEVEAEVDPHLELAEIHRRVIQANGPALLFKRVKGKRFPVVTNLFGTRSRVDLAFGDLPKSLVRRVAKLPEELLPPSPARLWRQRDLARPLLKVGFKRQSRAPVMAEQIPGADLTQLPAVTSWELDGGPFVTLPLVHTKVPDDLARGLPDNLGMYRLQIHDAKETGLHFQIGKGGGFHLEACERAGRSLPVNVYLGGPPALILAAIAPLPENVPELLLASLVQGDRLKRTSVGGESPDIVSEAEFCLVGEAPAGVRRPEGPFGDHYGYYSLQHDYPVFRPRAIYHRKDAIYPATIVGKPRQEDFFLGDYLQELLSPLFPLVMPAVRDLWSYGETGYHSLGAAVLRERYGRESLSAAFRILGEGQLALTKFLIGIDAPVDLKDFRAVLTHALARVDWEKDLYVFAETAMDTLDYAGPQVNKGSKGLLLGLGEPRRELPREFKGGGALGVVRDVRVFSPGCLVVELPKWEQSKEAITSTLARKEFDEWPLIVAVDDAKKATATVASFLWTAFTRMDPASDLHARTTRLVGHKVVYGGPVLLDARMKPWYPAELECDAKTAEVVGRRWREYFPGGGEGGGGGGGGGRTKVEMGDSKEGHLMVPG